MENVERRFTVPPGSHLPSCRRLVWPRSGCVWGSIQQWISPQIPLVTYYPEAHRRPPDERHPVAGCTGPI